jgi:hypothetical protein
MITYFVLWCYLLIQGMAQIHRSYAFSKKAGRHISTLPPAAAALRHLLLNALLLSPRQARPASSTINDDHPKVRDLSIDTPARPRPSWVSPPCSLA